MDSVATSSRAPGLPVTVIVSTRNRPALLLETVRGIFDADAAPAELVVVDQSDVPNPDLGTLSGPQDCQIRYLHSFHPGASGARNQGARVASHDLLVFLDDDLTVDRGWLLAFTSELTRQGPKVIYTGQVGEMSAGPGSFAPSCTNEAVRAVYKGGILRDPLSSGNMALHRSAFEAVGGFDERLGPGKYFPAAEDNDLGFRLLQSGFVIEYLPEALAFHRAWRAEDEVVSLKWRYGLGQGAFFAKHLTRSPKLIGRRLAGELIRPIRALPERIRSRRARRIVADFAYVRGDPQRASAMDGGVPVIRDLPRTSVVIATYNRAGPLTACLAALARQSASDDFEVIVVVDGSSDYTESLLASLSTIFPLRPIWQNNQGQSAALNRGAAEARGELLIFLDDDIIVSPDFVRGHMALFARDPAAVGVGQMLLRQAPGADWFAHAFEESWRNHYDRLNANPNSVTWRDCFGGNMSVSRERFLRVGGFARDLARGYDIELAVRLAADGGHFVYLPKAAGLQDERKNYRSLLRDSQLGGRGAVGIYRRHPQALPLIGHFPEQTPQAAIVLRALLRLDLSPAFLALALGWAPRLLGRERLFFGLLHRYAFWRGVKYALDNRDAWEQLSHGVVILMYHGFCVDGERAGRYLMHPARFRNQMQWLKRRGYKVLSVEDYVALRHSGAVLPAKAAVITMDDGYAEVASFAIPLLQRLGFPATVFLPTGRIGEANDWDVGSELYGRSLLSWSDVRSLRGSGVSFGAHTRKHLPLTELSLQERQEEIAGPQEDFEREIGVSAASFSYPYGEFRPEFSELLAKAGYKAGVSVEPGPNTPLTDTYALRRVEIWGQESLLAFGYALATGRELRAAFRRTRQVFRRTAGGAFGNPETAGQASRAEKTLATEKN